MARLIWSPRAADQLLAACEYVARDSPDAARALAQMVTSMAQEIARLPLAGRVVPELGEPSVRERIVGRYRVVYEIRGNAVEILAIVHGARLLPGLGD